MSVLDMGSSRSPRRLRDRLNYASTQRPLRGNAVRLRGLGYGDAD
jgi:hypothetical protein